MVTSGLDAPMRLAARPRGACGSSWLPIALACLLAGACHREPRPPEAPNIRLAITPTRSDPLPKGETEGQSDGDTEVLAEVVSLPLYGQTHDGDRTTYWMLVTCRVLEVRRGTWSAPSLRFVNAQTWVAAGAKFYEYGPRIYYDTGWVFTLRIRHGTQGLPQIVSQTRQ